MYPLQLRQILSVQSLQTNKNNEHFIWIFSFCSMLLHVRYLRTRINNEQDMRLEKKVIFLEKAIKA
jgi:hypothetical protein